MPGLRIGLAVVLGLAASAASAGGVPGADEVVKRWHGRLDRVHFTASVRMVLEREGIDGERALEAWRDDEPSQGERFMARFVEPFDLRGVSLLYIEQPSRSNDYFLYQPGLKRVRRIPPRLAKEDIYGLDLEFIGFGRAQNAATVVESVEEVELEGRPAYMVTERVVEASQRFDRRRVWLDPTSYLTLKTEHERQGRVVMIGRTLEVRSIQGIPTPIRTVFERPTENRSVTLIVEAIDYEAPIPEQFFSTLHLVKSVR